MSKSPNWEDWVGIGLGAWLLASPWVVGFSHQAAPTVNALLVGTILLLAEFLDLVVHGKTYRYAPRGRGRKPKHPERGSEPEPLFGLS
jgi:hypothetical protein